MKDFRAISDSLFLLARNTNVKVKDWNAHGLTSELPYRRFLISPYK